MQPQPPGPTDWPNHHLLLILVLLFIAIWVLVGYVVSFTSGWMALSGRFRYTGGFYSYQWSFQSVRLRSIWGSYNNCVNIGADQTGLHMGLFALLRSGHPPLFIPWSEIQVVNGNQGWIFKSRKLLLGREESIPLFVSLSLARKLQEAAGQAWPAETTGA